MFDYSIEKDRNMVTIFEKDDETGIVTDIFDRFEIPENVSYNVCKLRTYNEHCEAFELWVDEPENYTYSCSWYRLYFPDGDHIDSFM